MLAIHQHFQKLCFSSSGSSRGAAAESEESEYTVNAFAKFDPLSVMVVHTSQ